MTDFETMPLTIPVTAEEMDRLEDYAMRNPVSLTANAHENFLHTSIDNWWAFILLAVWRGQALKKLTPEHLTVQDLIDAPQSTRAQNERGERFLKAVHGWVQILPTGEWVSSYISPQDIVSRYRPTYFE